MEKYTLEDLKIDARTLFELTGNIDAYNFSACVSKLCEAVAEQERIDQQENLNDDLSV